jgi:hypothetical protein
VNVPAGCLEDLSGPWVHDDSRWLYDATDDGGTLTLVVTHRFVPDAGRSYRRFTSPTTHDGGLSLDAGQPALDAGPLVAPSPNAVVTLFRTPMGFTGEAVGPISHPVGKTCQAHWKTEVLSCGDAGLRLRSESEVALGDVCQPPIHPQPTVWLEHHLHRVP